MRSILLMCLLVVGCSKKSEAPAANPCETSINQAIDAMTSKRQGAGAETMNEIATKLRTIMIDRCKADGWPKEALDCYAASTDQPGMRACRQKLPQEMSAKLQAEIMKVMSNPGSPGGSRGGMPPHGGAAPEGAGGAAPAATDGAGSAAPATP